MQVYVLISSNYQMGFFVGREEGNVYGTVRQA